jgi:hypothetical protein
MRSHNHEVTTGRGSVRYLDGQFFTPDWQVCFVPLSNVEFHSFYKEVEKAEALLGARLPYSQLVLIAQEVSGGNPAPGS